MMIKGTSQRWLTQCVVTIVTGIIVGASSASALDATRSEPVRPASNWRFQPDGADGCSMVAGYRPDHGDPSQAIFGQSFTVLRSQPDQVIFSLSADSRGDGNDSDPDASHGITTIQMFLNFRDGPTFDLPTYEFNYERGDGVWKLSTIMPFAIFSSISAGDQLELVSGRSLDQFIDLAGYTAAMQQLTACLRQAKP